MDLKKVAEAAKTVRMPVMALLIYLVIQLLVSLCVPGKTTPSGEVSAQWLGTTLFISSVLTTAAIVGWRRFDLRRAFTGVGCCWKGALAAICGTLLGLLAASIFNDFLPLKNVMEESFSGMSNCTIGLLAIALVGPICEEVVFRGGVMQPLLNRGVRPWVVIAVSAAIFGLVHLNPAQIRFAAICGVIFAVVFYRTGSLVIPIVCHVANNSFSAWQMIRAEQTGEPEATWTGLLGGTVPAIAVMLLAAAASALLLRYLWRHTEPHARDERDALNDLLRNLEIPGVTDRPLDEMPAPEAKNEHVEPVKTSL